MLDYMLKALALAVAIYATFGLYLYWFQDRFIYHPTPDSDYVGMTALRLQADGVSLKIWQANPGRPQAVIYFGGNAQDGAAIAAFEGLLPRHTLYGANYRGYGGSGGRPSQTALYADALGIFDHLRARYDKIAVIGRSLGSAPAMYLAAQRPVDRIALITPFESALKVAQHHYPFYPIAWMLNDHYDNMALAPATHSRAMLFVAGRDRTVPPTHAQNLSAAMAGPTEIVLIPQARHNDITGFGEFEEGLTRFFAD